MPFVTGTGLGGATGGPSAVVEALRTEIDSKMTGTKGVDWIERVYTGSIGARNREYWVEIPAAKTVHGRTLIFGFREHPTLHHLEINSSHLSWTLMTTGVGAGTFARMDGQPMDKTSAIEDATQDYDGPFITGGHLMETGAAYVRHWIITSTGWGTNSPSDELCLIFTIEVSVGRYVTFGFWELEQFGDWSADAQDATAGYGFDCTCVGDEGSGLDDRNGAHSFFLSMQFSQGFNDAPRAEPGTHFIPHSLLAKYGGGAAVISPWAVTGSKKITTDAPRASVSTFDFAFGENSGSQNTHDHLIGASVSTGIAQRLPARLYLHDIGSTTPSNIMPVGNVPLCYFLNIGALNPGSIETFGGEDFLVIPYLEKNQGSFNTGNRGYLFRL